MPMITSALSLCIRLSDVLSRPRISAFIKKSLEKGSFLAELNELVSQFRESE